MVTFAQAQERAEEWINGDVPSYQHREVRVREFDLGFVVWAEDRTDGPRSDGGAQRLVIARDSGEATLWPSLPVGEVIRRYEEEYGRDTGPEDAAPTPPARVDLNQTSFLLTPPEWLQDAADKLGIGERGDGAGRAADSADASGDGSGAGAGAGAGSAGPAPGARPWTGTDTNGGEDLSVALPDTVFSAPVNGAEDAVRGASAGGGAGEAAYGYPQGAGGSGGPGGPGTPPPVPGAQSYGYPQAPGGPAPAPSAGDIADLATSKLAPPGRGAQGGGSAPPPPPGAPGAPGGPSGGGYVPTQFVSAPGGEGPSDTPPVPGTGAGPTPPPPPPPSGAQGFPGGPAFPHGPGGSGAPGTAGGPDAPAAQGFPGGYGFPGAPGAPGAPGTPGPPPPPGAPGTPGAAQVPGTPGPVGAPHPPGAPQPPGPPGAPGGPHGAVHHAETVLSTPPPGAPTSPPGVPGAPGVPMPPPGAPGAPAVTQPMPPGATPPPPPGAVAPPGAAPTPPGPMAPPPASVPPGQAPAYGYPQQSQPTVGPGYQAVLRYRAQDGSEQQLIRRSAPGTPHPEWQIFHELRGMNVPPDQVLELHTELESCELPGAYCARMIREQWPQARITSIAPYGTDHASRQQGMQQLLAHQGELHQVADGPARPAPVRAPLPPVQAAPPVPPEGVAQELAAAFGPGLFRFEQIAVDRQGVPPVVAHSLVVAGLPLDMGPFFWAQAQPGRPVPTLAELAAERGVRPASDAGSYLVMGSDFGKAICVQYGTANIVAVPVEAGPGGAPVPPQFVNTGLPEFQRCLALLGRMWRLRFGLNQEQAGRWTVDFQAQLASLDPAALGSPESWWSVLLEEMWDGLL